MYFGVSALLFIIFDITNAESRWRRWWSIFAVGREWLDGRNRRFCGSARTRKKLGETLKVAAYSSSDQREWLALPETESCETYQMTCPESEKKIWGKRQSLKM